MNKFILFLFLFSPLLSQAQKFTLKGQLTDTLSSPMPSATIMILQPSDSSLVNFGVSDAKGFFEIKNLNRAEYLFKVSFVGFATYTQKITPSTGMVELNLGQVKLKPKATELDEVVVQGEKAPVTVKRDTIEFNAGSFKTKANANVEDLLKKMPGVEVENDGTIRAQGEQVQRVTVDGREFFGRDPKLATRNLPADAIDKVQVFDRKSDQTTFTGIDDGQKEKTINLELKEEKRNGAFGTLMAGGGTDDRFQGRASINKFGKGKQLSILGMGNNINEQGFSIDDYMNFTGGAQQIMGGGGGAVRLQFDGNNSNGVPLNFGGRQNGIMTNYAGGVNVNRDLNANKTKISGSYFYNRIEQNVIRSLNRINYLPNNQTYNFAQNSRQLSTNDNHRVNLTVDHSIDSANSIRFTSSLTYNEAEQTTTSHSETMSATNALQNESDRNTFTAGTSATLNSNLLYRHKFARKGRTFSTNLSFGLSQNDSEGDLSSSNLFYTGPVEKRDILQTNTQATDNLSYGTTLSYTEPLGKRRYLEANYNFRINENKVDREVYNEETGQPVFNNMLSNKYNSNYTYHRPGFNLRVNRQKYNFALGASYQMTELKGNLILRDAVIDRSFENLLPVARFNYDFSSFKHLRLDYETSMQEPTIQQLQPVVDNSDPLNISMGNPDLRPGYNHRLNANFTTFDPAKFINFFAFATATYTTNAISYAQSISPELIRTSMPVNVKDNLVLTANMNFGFPIKKLKSRFNIGPALTHMEAINLLNDEENRTTSQTQGGTARYNFTWNDILTIDLSSNLSRQQTRYDFNSELNQEYLNETYSAETNFTFLKNYQFNGSFEYLVYNSRTTDFKQSIPLLNLYFSRFILKNKTGEIKIGVNNLLDKSLSVVQTATANYLQQETTNNLGRFYMVSFTYALNKQLNPMGAGRRPGMRMMFRN
jgi:Outer membrane protein beta-barrel family/CarboxypepD_reg-like domain